MTKTPILQPQLEQLHVKQIHMDYNHRELGDVSDIMLSIQKEGQITPIMVFKKKGQYEVIAGHRRLVAIKKLGLPYIRAEVYPHVAAQKVLIQQAIENTARSPLTVFEQAILFRKLEDSGLSLKEMAIRLGVSWQTVRKVDTAAKYIPKNKLVDISYGKLTKGAEKVPLSIAQMLAVARKHNRINVKEFNELWARVKEDKMCKFAVKKFLDRKWVIERREQRLEHIKTYHDGKLPKWAEGENFDVPPVVEVPKVEPTTYWLTIKVEVSHKEIRKKGFWSKYSNSVDKHRLQQACKKVINKHVIKTEERW